MVVVEDSKSLTAFVGAEMKTGSTRIEIVSDNNEQCDTDTLSVVLSFCQDDNEDINFIDDWIGNESLEVITEMPQIVYVKVCPTGLSRNSYRPEVRISLNCYWQRFQIYHHQSHLLGLG